MEYATQIIEATHVREKASFWCMQLAAKIWAHEKLLAKIYMSWEPKN